MKQNSIHSLSILTFYQITNIMQKALFLYTLHRIGFFKNKLMISETGCYTNSN